MIKANATPKNITRCTLWSKAKNKGGAEEGERREMHIKSILELVINTDITKYPKVNVRAFKRLLNAPGNWWAHYQQKSSEHTGRALLSKQTEKQLKMNFLVSFSEFGLKYRKKCLTTCHIIMKNICRYLHSPLTYHF